MQVCILMHTIKLHRYWDTRFETITFRYNLRQGAEFGEDIAWQRGACFHILSRHFLLYWCHQQQHHQATSGGNSGRWVHRMFCMDNSVLSIHLILLSIVYIAAANMCMNKYLHWWMQADNSYFPNNLNLNIPPDPLEWSLNPNNLILGY